VVKQLISLVGLGVACALMTSCGDANSTASDTAGGDAAGTPDSDWAQIVAAAKEEGSVTLYTTRNPGQAEALKKAFAAEHPDITLEYFSGALAEVYQRYDAEQAAGGAVADVLYGGDLEASARYRTEGAYTKISTDGPSASLWGVELDEGVVQVDATPIVMIYNTDLVPETPTSFEDLLKPEFKGRVVIPDHYNTSTVFFIYDSLGEELLERIAELEPTVTANSQTNAQAVASGEAAWSPLSFAPALTQLIDAGAPIAWTLPESGDIVTIPFSLLVAPEPTHPNAAQVLADFLLSTEAGKIFAEDAISFHPNAAAIPGTIDLDQDRVVRYDPGSPEHAEYSDPANIERFSARFDELFR
jgi:iron(III) transport system substrate-binding protein